MEQGLSSFRPRAGDGDGVGQCRQPADVVGVGVEAFARGELDVQVRRSRMVVTH
ncbi:MAG TPA: hypothetical protein PKB03_04540 [Baekduia sp.]|nr:hypothetical protein [Baekduia sp.]